MDFFGAKRMRNRDYCILKGIWNVNKIIKKGCFGYIKNRRVVTGLRTILFFAVSIGLYIMGYVTTGSNKNLLTIVAVLGCLPACKSAVNFIIYLRATGCSDKLHEMLTKQELLPESFYELYFTSYQKNYAISHMTLHGSVLCGICEDAKCNVRDAEKHLENMLLQEGVKNITVKIFADQTKYLERLKQLSELQADKHKQHNTIVNMLFTISL